MEDVGRRYPARVSKSALPQVGVFWRFVFVPLFRRVPWSFKQKAMRIFKMTTSNWPEGARRFDEPWRLPTMGDRPLSERTSSTWWSEVELERRRAALGAEPFTATRDLIRAELAGDLSRGGYVLREDEERTRRHRYFDKFLVLCRHGLLTRAHDCSPIILGTCRTY